MKKLFLLTMLAAMFCCTIAVGADKIQFKTIRTHIKTPACDYKLSIDYPMGNSVTDNNTTKELELPKGNKMYITEKYVTFTLWER